MDNLVLIPINIILDVKTSHRHSRILNTLLKVSPDISLPEAGLAVLHVPLVVAHSHGSVVSVVAPERVGSY